MFWGVRVEESFLLSLLLLEVDSQVYKHGEVLQREGTVNLGLMSCLVKKSSIHVEIA